MQANSIILQMKYARIIECIAEMKNISLEDAMKIFYSSKTFELISNGVADMHCMSDKYLAEEICRE
ncbi:MAG: DUF3791 domain-containing protein [Bacteroidales bacterium]|nr:DUF3791 domain-containing protein [Bacteroidales bacterium]